MGKAHATKDTFVNPYNSSTTAKFNDYEFGGPIGALAITIILPIVTLALVHFASVGGIDLKFFSSPFSSSSNRQVMKEISSSGTITVVHYLWRQQMIRLIKKATNSKYQKYLL